MILLKEKEERKEKEKRKKRKKRKKNKLLNIFWISLDSIFSLDSF